MLIYSGGPTPGPSGSTKVEVKNASRKQICLWSLPLMMTVFLMILTLLLIVFVIFPIAFKYSPKLQQDFIFPIGKAYSDNHYEYQNFQKHGLVGVRNMHVLLENVDGVILGLWHILPEALKQKSTEEGFDYERALYNSSYPVLIYFHGGVGNRIHYIHAYRALRKFFHVIAFDYRSYGDSTRKELSEKNVVEDCVKLHKWLRCHTLSDLYFWGYELGSVLSAHTAARLSQERYAGPAALFLEASFMNMTEVIEYRMMQGWLTKFMSLMPWFEVTMLQPFEDNDLNFKIATHIAEVDCPISIIHSPNDTCVPFIFGWKTVRQARKENQGDVNFFSFPSDNADEQNENVNLTTIIRQHIVDCEELKKDNSM